MGSTVGISVPGLNRLANQDSSFSLPLKPPFLQDANCSEEKRKSVLTSTTKCGVEFSEPSLAAKRAREDPGLVPLIIPVSVPVRAVDPTEVAQVGGVDEDGKDLNQHPTEHKPSVIVTRRRSTRIPGTDASAQVRGCFSKPLEGVCIPWTLDPMGSRRKGQCQRASGN